MINTGCFFTGFVKNVLNIVVVPPNTHKLSLSMSKSPKIRLKYKISQADQTFGLF